jgi:hypothetical protein
MNAQTQHLGNAGRAQVKSAALCKAQVLKEGTKQRCFTGGKHPNAWQCSVKLYVACYQF